jgi:hypothetical protein
MLIYTNRKLSRICTDVPRSTGVNITHCYCRPSDKSWLYVKFQNIKGRVEGVELKTVVHFLLYIFTVHEILGYERGMEHKSYIAIVTFHPTYPRKLLFCFWLRKAVSDFQSGLFI